MSGKTAAPADRKASAASAKAQARTAKGASPHVEAAAGTELARNALSRQRYEFVMKVTSGFVILAILLSVFIVYLATRPVEYRYFATDSRGSIRELVALNRPIQTDEEVLNWATAAVTKAYSMSFANYGQQLNDLKVSFTEAGWRGYEQALQRAGFLDALLKNQYVTSSVPKKAPVVVAQGIVNGVYGWRLQIPLIVTFTSASNSSSQDINVEVTVVRRHESENPSGLGIAQILSQ
jgi:Macrophage killing protein with similarity to conjugation protein.